MLPHCVDVATAGWLNTVIMTLSNVFMCKYGSSKYWTGITIRNHVLILITTVMINAIA